MNSVNVTLCSTGMVSIPPKRGGAIEAYVYDLAKMFSYKEDIMLSVISNVRERVQSESAPNVRFVPSKSPVDAFPLGIVKGTIGHFVGGLFTSIVATEASRKGDGSFGPADVIHTNEEVSLAFLSKRLLGTPSVFTLHNPPPDIGDSRFGTAQYLYRDISAKLTVKLLKSTRSEVISINPAITDWFIRNGIDDSRIHNIPLPIDTERFSPIPEFPHSNSDYAIFVGRLDSRKNILTILNAMVKHQVKHKLIIVGDGELKEELKTIIDKHGLNEQIRVYSNISQAELLKLYQQARFMVFPSHLEAYPRSLIEAASCGLPVLHQDIPLLNEFVSWGFTKTFTNNSGKNIIDSIDYLYSEDSEINRLSLKSREFALKRVSYESVGKEILRVYRKAAEV